MPTPQSDPPVRPPGTQAKKQREYLSYALNGEKPLQGGKAWRGGKIHRGKGDLHKGGPERPEYFADVEPKFVVRDLKDIKRVPLTKHAEKLLANFRLRKEFWGAIERESYPVDLAGSIYLGYEKRASQLMHGRIEDAGDPWYLFYDEAEEGFKSGKILPGMETSESPVADIFYETVAGGPLRADDLWYEHFGSHSAKIYVEEACEAVKGIVQREACAYWLFKYLITGRR